VISAKKQVTLLSGAHAMQNQAVDLLPALSAEPSTLPDLGSLVVDIDPEQVTSPALRRLLEEVCDDVPEDLSPKAAKYNRTHNRHNRQFLLPSGR
jgi:hypothetical protein